MKVLHTVGICSLFAAAALFAASPQASHAQDRERGTVAVYPVIFNHNSGDETSRKTAIGSIDEMLQKGGFTLISSRVAANTWRKLGLPNPTADEAARRTDLVRL